MKKKLAGIFSQNHFGVTVDAEFATGWFKFLVQNADYKEANRVGELLRSQNKSIVGNSRLHKIELDVWDALLRTQTASDEDLHFAQNRLVLAIRELKRMGSGIKRNIVLGYAYNNLGYLLRVQGKYYGACTAYRNALPIWRELKLDEGQAITLNNFAFALAEVGVFNVAQNLALDAYELRQKLNNLFLVSLSLNTLAHIAVRENKPDLAIRYINEALKRSEQIPNLRAHGLTLIVGSEAYRRRLRTREARKTRNRKDLEIALDFSQEACSIFTKIIKEPERRVEALIELGCTYRDFAKYSRRGFEVTKETEDYGKKAEKALRQAARIAKQEKITYRAVDALVNLAWLKYYLRQNVEEVLAEALVDIPESYVSIHRKRNLKADMNNHIVPYLIQLGKAYTLKGQMHFSLFNDKSREKGEREKNLSQAIRFHAKALEYIVMVGPAVTMQMRNTHDRIYRNIRKLNPKEVSIVLHALDSVEKEYQMNDRCEMRNFLVSHGLIED